MEVHKDYMTHFTEARSLAQKNPKDPRPAIKYLEDERRTLEPVRVKLAAFARTLMQPEKPSLMDEFLISVARYFPVGDLYADRGSASTSLISELRSRYLPKQPDFPMDFVYWTPNNISNEEMQLTQGLQIGYTTPKDQSPVELIDAFIGLQQAKWKTACETFAKLKAADLKEL
jgi:hypothetical protein